MLFDSQPIYVLYDPRNKRQIHPTGPSLLLPVLEGFGLGLIVRHWPSTWEISTIRLHTPLHPVWYDAYIVSVRSKLRSWLWPALRCTRSTWIIPLWYVRVSCTSTYYVVQSYVLVILFYVVRSTLPLLQYVHERRAYVKYSTYVLLSRVRNILMSDL